MQIKLFHPDTYPDEVITIRKKLKEVPHSVKYEMISAKYLCDYTSSALWNTNEPFGKLHQELMNILEPYQITGYHNTRLPDKTSIENSGLIFSDERYVDMIATSMVRANIEHRMVDEVLNVVRHERDRWQSDGQNRRKNEVCFIYDMDYYKDYEKFLAVYGGEFMEFGLSSHTKNQSLLKYKDIIKIGHPYVVEFVIPFKWMTLFEKQDVARYMLEEWIHLYIRQDEPEHQYDGRIECEIPADKIIAIHEVEDEFTQIDNWMFREEK